ncbi:MAG: GNAT family N-acetyltransferase [Bacteriodetes bacterium]|nr:GNAT family N-acetyltransferase [Bacteroidota bacterium]
MYLILWKYKRMTIVKLSPEEFDSFFSLICALADYEKLERPSAEARERLYNDAFSDKPRYESYLVKLADGVPVAYCIVFETYSSFLAKPTLYLEDIFVLPEFRNMGIGTKVVKHLAKLAIERNCGRIEWVVLDWNQNAIDFYNNLGGLVQKEWLPYRITEDKFPQLSGE